MFLSTRGYKLLGFEKSRHRHKKYDAVLRNLASGRLVRMPFGDASYAQYKDTTRLGLYSHLDHLDPRRRRLYRIRHANDVKAGFYSPGYMSWNYLW
jgi:hypothetical protein